MKFHTEQYEESINDKEFGLQLQRTRIFLGISVTELSRVSGIEEKIIKSLEKGKMYSDSIKNKLITALETNDNLIDKYNNSLHEVIDIRKALDALEIVEIIGWDLARELASRII